MAFSLASLLKRKPRGNKVSTALPSLLSKEGGLVITVGTSGFSVSEMGGSGEIIASGELPHKDETTVDRVEAALQAAVSQSPAKQLKQAASVAVVIDSDDTQFVDMRHASLGSASNERLREFGTRLTGARFVSFGRMPFGAETRSKTPHGVLGFIDHGSLERYLAALGEHCTKLTHIVPAASLLVSRAMGFERESYAGVLFGGTHSTIIVANYQRQTVMVRFVPVGRETLVAAVAKQAAMSHEQVLQNFGQRDYFRALIEKQSEDGSDISIGPIEDAMMPHLRKLSSEVLNTFDFFEQQLSADLPKQLELVGEADQLKGFRDWMQAALSLDVQRVDTSLADSFRHGNSEQQLNLLTGLEGNPISVGKARYTMEENKLVRSSAPKRKPAQQASAGGKGRDGKKGRRRSAQTAPGEGLFAKLFKKGDDRAKSGTGEDGIENEGAFFFLFGAMIFGLFFWGYQNYTKVNKRHDAVALAYNNQLAETKRLKQELANLGVAPTVKTSNEEDKVLWTEKFLSLADQMTSDIWLTDVHVEDGTTKFGDFSVTTKKLTIEGAALPSSEGHIAEIADFIRRLEDDNVRFMNDFRSVSFEGSNVDANDRDPVVRFRLSAWYDKSKRVELRKDLEKPAEQNDSPLATMQKNVAKRNQALEASRTGGGR